MNFGLPKVQVYLVFVRGREVASVVCSLKRLQGCFVFEKVASLLGWLRENENEVEEEEEDDRRLFKVAQPTMGC